MNFANSRERIRRDNLANIWQSVVISESTTQSRVTEHDSSFFGLVMWLFKVFILILLLGALGIFVAEVCG